MQVPLDVAGELEARSEAGTVRITASQSTITVDLPNLRAGMTAFRGTGGRSRRAGTISRAGAILDFTDLSVRVRLAGGTIALLGAEARPGFLSRVLALGPLEIRLLSLLRSLSRRA